ncbi:MAG: peptidase S41, partial [Odoribacteraceae bacterium]|nr:peptidase S41 [Odoribacteraceae bacterium]
ERALAPVIPELKRYLKALIARDLWGINEYYKLVNENNAPLRVAIKALQDGSYEKLLGRDKK